MFTLQNRPSTALNGMFAFVPETTLSNSSDEAPTLNEAFAGEMRQLLIDRFLQELCVSTGISPIAMAGFLNGTTTIPNLIIFRELAKHLRLPPEKVVELDLKRLRVKNDHEQRLKGRKTKPE
jgi:hypothetical protein